MATLYYRPFTAEVNYTFIRFILTSRVWVCDAFSYAITDPAIACCFWLDISCHVGGDEREVGIL